MCQSLRCHPETHPIPPCIAEHGIEVSVVVDVTEGRPLEDSRLRADVATGESGRTVAKAGPIRPIVAGAAQVAVSASRITVAATSPNARSQPET